jgi:putative RecB family exonuclease
VPRKPSLSPSKITTYLACALKYRWTFVHPHRWLVRAKHYYSFGSSLHAVLEKVYEKGDAGVDAHELDAVFDENWIDAGYVSSEAMQEAYGEGKEMIEQFLDEERRLPSYGKTLAVEKLLRYDMGEWDLVGRIDRLVLTDDGAIEIIDYKTRRQSVTESEVKHDIAMCAYQLLVKRSFPGYEPGQPVRARLVALSTQASAAASLTDEELAEFEFELRELGNHIMNHDWFELEASFKPICRVCDFLSLCERDEEFKSDLRRAERG